MDYHLHAGMPEQDYADFIAAVTSEFAEALEEVIVEVDATQQDCFDPLLEVYGLEFNPVRLHETTEQQILELRDVFAETFETEKVQVDQIREAVLRSKARWPA